MTVKIQPLLMGAGKLTRRWNVVCARCTEWDIPSGTKSQAEQTLRDSGWQKIGSRWICKGCVNKAEKA